MVFSIYSSQAASSGLLLACLFLTICFLCDGNHFHVTQLGEFHPDNYECHLYYVFPDFKEISESVGQSSIFIHLIFII